MNEATMSALFRAQLPTRAVAVLGYILTHQTANERPITYLNMSTALGMNVITISRAVQDLKDEGILVVENRPFATAEYAVNEEVLKRLAKP